MDGCVLRAHSFLAGKILLDASIISEYKIQENGFVVVMVNKAKSGSATKQAATTSVSFPVLEGSFQLQFSFLFLLQSASVSTPTPSQPTTDSAQET